ncbi:predicted protein [Sparassis crispa]|uniref:Uncharacterized protein n=1 Tax=Sparassis crispa TaxID=139825 RepID=A0A401G7F9_9APHY|nr:predicted protein [Sparassis crispa]GBE78105.1 predicted protein [Sparassis crispa]
MANTEITDLSDSSTKVVGASSAQVGAGIDELSSDSGQEIVVAERPDGHNAEASPLSLSPGSASTPLGGSSANGLHPGANNPPTLTVPHPKRFSHVNINKKFLEKASSTSPSGQTLSASATMKTGSSSQKPVLQMPPSHSRLVTTKLTATPQPSTTTGPGWSRPSSTVSSVAPTPISATNPKTPAVPTPAPSHPAPQPTTVGKVIQPQPRSVSDISGGINKKPSSSRSAWGNAKVVPAVVQLDAVAADFPTAAEVAQGRTTKLMEKKQAAELAEVQKQAITAEEDTFRGVHLDPNAHHWDEMEEDDDNFLGGVIEFDDGRQYKIQPADVHQQSTPELATASAADSTKQAGTLSIDQPVSKEDRFADDFDRSWPRSRITTTFPQQQRDPFPNGPASATSSQSHHSPQESSRVLFNERSNKLEPYSHAPLRQGVPGATSYLMRRGSRSDQTASPTDTRFARDLPPHTQGVQLLQKAPDGRAFGDHFGHPPFEQSRFRDRDASRRDATFPPLHSMTRTPSQGHSRDHYGPFAHASSSPRGISGELPSESWARRSTAMGPPSPSTEPLRDGVRQLPPHLSEMPHPTPPAPTVSGSESRVSATLISEAPHDVSPVTTERSLQSSAMPIVDIEEVRKAAMHSAAERAKLRRQHEEEEREKEKERARQKAAELEEKMKTMEQAKTRSHPDADATDGQVDKLIQDAVRSAQSVVALAEPVHPPVASQGTSPVSAKPLFSKGASTSRRSSFHVETYLPGREGESWRSKATSARSPSSHPDISPMHPPPPLLAEVESLTLSADENLEVFDFSELDKLVGAEKSPQRPDMQISQGAGLPLRPTRAVASDFFDNHAPTVHGSADSGRSDSASWRRKPSHYRDYSMENTDSTTAIPLEHPRIQVVTQDSSVSGEDSSAGSQEAVASHQRFNEESARFSGPNHSALPNHASQRSPLTPSYREAPMSALNDAILRIKGALDGMHHRTDLPEQQKWLPPALRPKTGVLEPSVNDPNEVFDRTGYEPPRSPRPAWNNFVVNLPHVSTPLEPVSARQPRLSRSQFLAQRNIFSWDISSDGTAQRNLTEALFGRLQFYRGHARYNISLPRGHIGLKPIMEETFGPVVNLPSKLARSTLQVVPLTGLQELGNTPESHTKLISSKIRHTDATKLDTISRSPPPEAAFSTTASLPKGDGDPSQAINGVSGKSRIQPKMPIGSDVAFYRDARSDAVSQPAAIVNFIVTSELEGEKTSELSAMHSKQTVPSPSHSSAPAQSTKLLPMDKGDSSIAVERFTAPESEYDLKKARSLERALATPPPQPSSSWMKSPRTYPTKDSPARAPDPEHLKAVWSQASDKAALPSVNSLEGIADDLTAVPFTLQDVKSEDGETPPPSGSGPPSRMSLHDVTRAFQQVPATSVNSANRGATLPALNSPPSGSISRQPTFAFSPPGPGSNMRSAYSPYPSPMMSHSPTPAVFYPPQMAPSPAPRPMVLSGTPPAYVQPMWMSVASPNGQAPSGVMRPLTSPYPAQLLPYPSPGGALPVYAPPPQNMQNGLPQQVNGMQNRTNGLTMMSPVMQAQPMYAGSPVLMPALPPGAYPGVPANRPQLRGGFDHAPGVPVLSSSVAHPPPSYAPYPRPTW